MQARIWSAIGGASLAWGTAGIATRAALNAGVPPIAMAAIRAVLASLLLLGVLRVLGVRVSRDPAVWRTGVVAAVFQLATPFVFFTLAYQYASAGFVGLIVALVPLGTATVAHFMLPDEPLHALKVAGLVTAFAGVAILLLSGDSGLDEGGRPLLAAALSVGAVTSISFASVYAKGKAGTYDPTELTWMQFAIGGALIVVLTIFTEGTPAEITQWGWTLIAYLTVIGSVVPFLLFYWLLRHVSSTKAALVGYIAPLVAISGGVILLDEQLQTGIVLGGILIFAGIILTNRAESSTQETAISRQPG
jgi:drug/metabolite transporter (DMT)-like permease